MNASVARNIEARAMAAEYDSVWIDFTKGLGAPLGAVLAASRAFIDAAWRWKQRLGGSMRQAGICAAACHYALDHNIARLAEDHRRASLFAAGLNRIAGVRAEAPQTNLVFLDASELNIGADVFAAHLRTHGVLFSVVGQHRLRAGFHLDISDHNIEEALFAIAMSVRKNSP